MWRKFMSDTVKDIMDSAMNKMRTLVDVNSVVGTPVVVGDGITIIPVSKISYGFGAGGSDFENKVSSDAPFFGGGCGTGVSVSPVGFLSIVNGNVSFLQVESFHGAIDRLIAMSPDLINKISSSFKNKKKDNDDNK